MNQFLTSQGYGLQYTIGKINVHSILTKDIWVLKTAYFSSAQFAGSNHNPLKEVVVPTYSAF